MSFYVADWYHGIIKSEFTADMERIWAAHDWSAADGEILSAIISAGLGEHTTFLDRYDFLEALPANSYDKETRTLCYGMSGNQHGERGIGMHNLFSYVLPIMTERIISYRGWAEDMGQMNTQMAEYFQRDMDEAQKVFKKQGLEGFLKQLL